MTAELFSPPLFSSFFSDKLAAATDGRTEGRFFFQSLWQQQEVSVCPAKKCFVGSIDHVRRTTTNSKISTSDCKHIRKRSLSEYEYASHQKSSRSSRPSDCLVSKSKLTCSQRIFAQKNSPPPLSSPPPAAISNSSFSSRLLVRQHLQPRPYN